MTYKPLCSCQTRYPLSDEDRPRCMAVEKANAVLRNTFGHSSFRLGSVVGPGALKPSVRLATGYSPVGHWPPLLYLFLFLLLHLFWCVLSIIIVAGLCRVLIISPGVHDTSPPRLFYCAGSAKDILYVSCYKCTSLFPLRLCNHTIRQSAHSTWNIVHYSWSYRYN